MRPSGPIAAKAMPPMVAKAKAGAPGDRGNRSMNLHTRGYVVNPAMGKPKPSVRAGSTWAGSVFSIRCSAHCRPRWESVRCTSRAASRVLPVPVK